MRFLLVTLLLVDVIAAMAQHTKTVHRQFHRFRVELAGSLILSLEGKPDPNYQASKKGFGVYLQPGWNITDNHNIGIKALLSNHAQDNSNAYSLFTNYTYTYYERTIRSKLFKLTGFFSGAGIGFSTGPVEGKTIQLPEPGSKTSFAIMPRAGFQLGTLSVDGHFHYAAGNKYSTYGGISLGAILGGGLRN